MVFEEKMVTLHYTECMEINKESCFHRSDCHRVIYMKYVYSLHYTKRMKRNSKELTREWLYYIIQNSWYSMEEVMKGYFYLYPILMWNVMDVETNPVDNRCWCIFLPTLWGGGPWSLDWYIHLGHSQQVQDCCEDRSR